MNLTESFWMFLIVSTLSLIGALFRIMYKSKCADVDICCGILHVRRNVDIEQQEDAMERGTRQQQDTPPSQVAAIDRAI